MFLLTIRGPGILQDRHKTFTLVQKRNISFRVPNCEWNILFPNKSFRTVLFRVPICRWNTLFPNWSNRTALFRVALCKWNTLFPNWSFGLFCSEFLFGLGTHCSQIGHLGLFCCEFYLCVGHSVFKLII